MQQKELLLFWKQSPFQRIAFFTEGNGTFSLTLNDFWQFNSGVEHIYHECLFTMPALFPTKLENMLILGGGDGLGARELLKYPSAKSIDLVDLDPEIIKFAKEHVIMKSLNKGSFHDRRVNITVTDAKKWLANEPKKKYDLVIIDFPDPTSDDLWTLYTEELYKQVASRMHKGSVVAIQSSTYNTRTFDLIFQRLNKVFPFIIGYHTSASSVFCGFFLCSFQPIKQNRPMPKDLKWLTPELVNRTLGLPVINPSEKGTRKKKVGPGSFGQTSETAGSAEKRFFGPDVAIPPSTNTGEMLKNPLVIGGVIAALALPLVLSILE